MSACCGLPLFAAEAAQSDVPHTKCGRQYPKTGQVAVT
jgi:ubiquitin